MKRKHIPTDIISANALFLVVSFCFFLAWRSYTIQVEEGRVSQVELMGTLAEDHFSQIVEQNIYTLRNLATRIEKTDGMYFDYWVSDAANIIVQNPSFRFVEFIDSNMIIKDIFPLKNNEQAINLDISTIEYRRDDWISAKRNKITNITPWINLVQTGEAFLVDEPIYINGHFWGTITAGLDFRDQVDAIFQDRPGYHMHLFDQSDELFYCNNGEKCSPVDLDSSLIYERSVSFEGMQGSEWRMVLFPTEAFFDDRAELANLTGFVISLILSAALAVAFFFVRRNRRQKVRASLANASLKELNINLDKERRKAQTASRTKSEFLSNMSHEIRTPINVISGLISLLKETNLEDEQKEQVRLLESSSKDLLGLVNNILEIERIEAGKVSIVKQAFQPFQRIESLVKTFEGSFENKGLYLRLVDQTKSDNKGVLIGDEVKIGQIISNLIRNGYKFTKEGGVTVYYDEQKIEEGKTLLKVKVQDTGIGIPSDELPQIFERFRQVESGYTKKFEGSGLGLSISKRLTEMQGGDIYVHSEEGVGTSFSVQIPMVTSNLNVLNNAQPTFDLDAIKDKPILLVEDNALNVLVMQKMLSSTGVNIETAENGKIALKKALQGDFEMILMDIHMPVMDGIEATKQLRMNGVRIPIVGLSANVTKETMNEALTAGMDAYLTKPISKPQLIQLFSKHLD